MIFPQIWFAQNNINDIKRGKITYYLILEGMDGIGQATLLADTEISSLVKQPDVVLLRVWCCLQSKLFNNLN
jgi:hypothetical protein